MKIIGLCRNYPGPNEPHSNPVFFLKPDTTILNNNKPFFLPPFSSQMNYEAEMVYKICKVGKNIAEKFAHRYYNEIAIGIDFTEISILKKCQAAGLPWEAAKSFDGSSPLSSFIPKEEFSDLKNINFRLDINEQTVQKSNTGEMIFDIDKIISYVSQFFTIKMGDIIFTGTPKGAGPVKIGDRLQAYIEEKCMLDFFIK